MYKDETKSLAKKYKFLRRAIINDRTVRPHAYLSEILVFYRPLGCRDPQEAANIICGSKVTGKQKWFEEKSGLLYWAYNSPEHNPSLKS